MSLSSFEERLTFYLIFVSLSKKQVIIGQFIQDAAVHVDTLRGATESGVAKALERSAHTLKSSSANIGALGMAEMCRELQVLGRVGSVAESGVLVERLGGEFDRVRQALELETTRIKGTADPEEKGQGSWGGA